MYHLSQRYDHSQIQRHDCKDTQKMGKGLGITETDLGWGFRFTSILFSCKLSEFLIVLDRRGIDLICTFFCASDGVFQMTYLARRHITLFCRMVQVILEDGYFPIGSLKPLDVSATSIVLLYNQWLLFFYCVKKKPYLPKFLQQ